MSKVRIVVYKHSEKGDAEVLRDLKGGHLYDGEAGVTMRDHVDGNCECDKDQPVWILVYQD